MINQLKCPSLYYSCQRLTQAWLIILQIWMVRSINSNFEVIFDMNPILNKLF